MRLPLWQRTLAGLTGMLLGIGVGLPLAAGHPLAAAFAAAIGGLLAVLIRRVVASQDRGALAMIVAGGLAVRFATASVLFDAASALGRSGYITGDDLGYSELAWGYVQWLIGAPSYPYMPPSWNGNAHLFNTFTYLEAAVYYFVGPQVLLMEFVNAGLAGATLVLAYAIAARLFGRTPGLIAVALCAVYPSLVLWSALNLKEALVLFLTSLVLLALPPLSRPKWWLLLGVYGVVLLLQSMRIYIFVGLSLIVPAALLVARWPTALARARWVAPATALSAVLVLFSGTASTFLEPLSTLGGLEHTRSGMAANARTGFVEPPPVVVVPNGGQTFVVQPLVSPGSLVRTEGGLGSPTPQPSPTQTEPPRVVYAGPNTRVVLAAPTPVAVASPPSTPVATTQTPTPTPQGAPDIVYVRPGDLVVIGQPGTPPLPEGQRQKLSLADRPDVSSIRFTITGITVPETLLLTTLTHFPTGLSHALFAPFVWDIRRTADLATVPEMLLWYVLAAAAVVTLWRERRAWRELTPLLLFVGGNLMIYSLAEGNVGTLFRHRGMIIPFTIVLASPSLLTWGRWVRRRVFSVSGR